MRLVSLRRQSPAINLSALVDVLFILIIFVMLAAEFDRTGAVDIDLPAADAPAAVGDAVRLVVPADGPARLRGRPIDDDALAPALEAARGGRPTLLIVADGDLPLRRATRLIDAGRRAGFTEVSIAAREDRQ
jgi:biopolymer transport protein ExbD